MEELHPLAEALDRRLAEPGMIDAERFAAFVAAQQAVGLVHGSQPLCQYLRPHVVVRVSRSPMTNVSTGGSMSTLLLVDGPERATAGGPRV